MDEAFFPRIGNFCSKKKHVKQKNCKKNLRCVHGLELSQRNGTNNTPTNRNGYFQPEKKLQALLSEPQKLREDLKVPVGIKNLGATCYINSVFQVLTSCAAFLKNIFKKPLDDPKEIMKQIQLTFAKLLLSMEHEQTLAPLLKSLNIDTSVQQDPVEFLKYLLNYISETMTETHTNEFQSIFSGKQIYRTICLQCNSTFSRSEGFINLSVFPILSDIEKTQNRQFCTLEACLKSGFDSEVLDDPDNLYSCENCKEKCMARREVALDSKCLPNLLFIQISRVKFNLKLLKETKNQTRLEYPLLLDVGDFCELSDNESVSTQYRLQAVISHKGNTADRGHYFCHVFGDSQIGFFKCDDLQITNDKKFSTKGSTAYFLVYAKCLDGGSIVSTFDAKFEISSLSLCSEFKKEFIEHLEERNEVLMNLRKSETERNNNIEMKLLEKRKEVLSFMSELEEDKEKMNDLVYVPIRFLEEHMSPELFVSRCMESKNMKPNESEDKYDLHKFYNDLACPCSALDLKLDPLKVSQMKVIPRKIFIQFLSKYLVNEHKIPSICDVCSKVVSSKKEYVNKMVAQYPLLARMCELEILDDKKRKFDDLIPDDTSNSCFIVPQILISCVQAYLQRLSVPKNSTLSPIFESLGQPNDDTWKQILVKCREEVNCCHGKFLLDPRLLFEMNPEIDIQALSTENSESYINSIRVKDISPTKSQMLLSQAEIIALASFLGCTETNDLIVSSNSFPCIQKPQDYKPFQDLSSFDLCQCCFRRVLTNFNESEFSFYYDVSAQVNFPVKRSLSRKFNRCKEGLFVNVSNDTNLKQIKSRIVAKLISELNLSRLEVQYSSIIFTTQLGLNDPNQDKLVLEAGLLYGMNLGFCLNFDDSDAKQNVTEDVEIVDLIDTTTAVGFSNSVLA